MKLIIVRHGRSNRLKYDRYSRKFDAELDSNYLDLLQDTKKYCEEINDFSLLSSKASRCTQTLEHLFHKRYAQPLIIKEFIPYCVGELEDKKDSWVRDNHREYYKSSYQSSNLYLIL